MNCDTHISRSELEYDPAGDDGKGEAGDEEGESTPLVARPLSLAAAMRGDGGGRRLLVDDGFLGILILAGPPPACVDDFQLVDQSIVIGMVSYLGGFTQPANPVAVKPYMGRSSKGS